MTSLDDRQRIFSALGRHWNPTAATMLAAAGRTVESHASGTQVYAEDGTAALDLAASYGVFLVGHGNPRVAEAVTEALREAPAVPPGAVHPATAALFRALLDILPAGLDRFVLGSSGAEICETALRAVRLARPDRQRIVVADGSYHGKTLAALSLLGQRNHRAPFEPLGGHLVVVPYGDAAAVRAAVADGSVAAVFLEPVLGGAHLTVPPPGYVREVADACAASDTLFVADEIQTGFGRTGRMFAVEHDGVRPDVMLLSKALTGGFVPVGVCALNSTVVAAAGRHPRWHPSLLASGSSVTGVAVAAAAATIAEVRDRDLPARAAELGPRLTEGLAAAVRRHPKHLLAAPGIGLMAGLRTANPAVELMVSIGMGQRGVHTGHSLNEQINEPVLRTYPPLTCTAEEIDQALAALEETLTWLDRQPRALTRAATALLRRQYRIPPRLMLRLNRSPIRMDWQAA
ncbi:aspartate aminotransferase family protein [Micromonospora narathiwatensis]|uniref:Putrescine aminotransferase n=1 Tax=Micromonospora narathiwatensis TaxID=299146 RepID=A0A1A8ZHH8_9ACTN|nr:aspartate aminotransferase family protein [Micromonospora narathiwatensis]SBT43297.1 putrescine aminotransferase [Micromonospora narathiwatensis]